MFLQNNKKMLIIIYLFISNINEILSSTKMPHYKKISSSSPIYANSDSLSSSSYYANYPSNFISFSSHKEISNPLSEYTSFTKSCYSSNLITATTSSFEIINLSDFSDKISQTYSSLNSLSNPILSCGTSNFILVEVISGKAKILLYDSNEGTNIRNSSEISITNNIIDCTITKINNYIVCFYYYIDNKSNYIIFDINLNSNSTSSSYSCSNNANNCQNSIEPDKSKSYSGIKIFSYSDDNILICAMKENYMYSSIVKGISTLSIEKLSTKSSDGNFANSFQCNTNLNLWDCTMLSDNLFASICYSTDNKFIYSEISISENIMNFYNPGVERKNIDISSNLPSSSYINLIIVSSQISGVFFSIDSNSYFSLLYYPVCNDLEISSLINTETEIDFLNYTNTGIAESSSDNIYIILTIPSSITEITFKIIDSLSTSIYTSESYKLSSLTWKYNSNKTGSYSFDFSVSLNDYDLGYIYCKLSLTINPSIPHCISSQISSNIEKCTKCENGYYINSSDECSQCDSSCTQCLNDRKKCLIDFSCNLYDSIYVCCSENHYPTYISSSDITEYCFTETEGIEKGYFLNGNIFIKCNDACSRCSGNGNDKCLSGDTSDDKNDYGIYCSSGYYPYKESTSKYICYTENEAKIISMFLNGNIILKCNDACLYCDGDGINDCILDISNCAFDRSNNKFNTYNICCNTNYFPYKNSDNTYTCYSETDNYIENNRLYLSSDNIFLQCNSACLYCDGSTNSNCLQDTSKCTVNTYNICCNTNYYPYKNSDNTYTCYLETDPIVITNRYYLTSNNIFVECDISCSICEGPSNSECKQDSIRCTTNIYNICCNSNYYPYESSTGIYTCYTSSEAKEESLYLSGTIYSSCDTSCLYCTGPTNTDCTRETSCTTNSNNICCNTNYYPLTDDSSTKCLTEIEGTNEGYYLHSTNKIFIKCSNECKTCSINSTNCLSCDNINYIKVENENTCLIADPIQEGYYIDNYLYKKCYSSCRTCSLGGNDNINNCTTCKYNDLINTGISNSNCCTESKKYWYLQNDNFYCIESCPQLKPILIEETNQCVDSCSSRECIYCQNFPNGLYMYENKCIDSCPENYVSNENNVCIGSEQCKYEYYTSLISINSLPYEVDKIGKNYSEYYYGVSNQVTLIKGKNSNYITSIYEDLQCLINLGNQTIIDMSECINKVFTKLNIDINTQIITLKTEYKENKGDSPIIAYAFYFLNGTRIDISLCSNDKIIVTVQLTSQNAGNVKLAEKFYEEYGINLYDINDKFFTDYCMPFTSEDGKDVSLEERIKKYYQNYTLCENGCDLKGFNYNGTTAEAECECDIKTNFLIDNLNNSLTGEFAEILANANFNLFQCYKNVFNIKKLVKNLGGWIIFIISVIQIVVLIIYLQNGFKNIFVELEQNSKRLMRKESFRANPPKKKLSMKANENINLNEDQDKHHKNIIKSEINLNNSSSLSKKEHKNKNEHEHEHKHEKKDEMNYYLKNHILDLNLSNDFDSPMPLKREKTQLIEKDKELNLNEEKIKTKKKNSELLKLTSDNYSETDSIKEIIIYEYITPDEMFKKNFDDNELDEMVVEDARKYDNRTFCNFYFSQLKEKQDIINIFCKQNTFESFQMRIMVFFYGMSLYFFLNALFYIESYISTEIHSKDNFSFWTLVENELQRCIFSQFVSFFVDLFEKCLDSSSKSLDVLLKSEKNPDIYLKKSRMIIRNMKKIHCWFIVFNFFSMVIFWYFCCAFCDVKYNTRINWIEGSIITFSIINCLPFLFCGITTILRFIGLKCKYLGFFYRVSQWID